MRNLITSSDENFSDDEIFDDEVALDEPSEVCFLNAKTGNGRKSTISTRTML